MGAYINIYAKGFISRVVAIALLALMASSVDSFFGPFWSLPPKFLTGFAAASGIGLINSVRATWASQRKTTTWPITSPRWEALQ